MLDTLASAALTTDTADNRVVVGLSGGVDSSTAAAVLKQQGYDVVGVTLWLMQGKGQCCSEGLVDAVRLCDQLGIEHHIVDSRDVFSHEIVDFFGGRLCRWHDTAALLPLQQGCQVQPPDLLGQNSIRH